MSERRNVGTLNLLLDHEHDLEPLHVDEAEQGGAHSAAAVLAPRDDFERRVLEQLFRSALGVQCGSIYSYKI